MKSELNAILTWLKANQLEINESMILSANVDKESKLTLLTLGFPTEAELVAFGSRCLSGASVQRIETPADVSWTATLTWRKVALSIRMLVKPDIALPAS